MKLIVGLGNPGKEYENTRHNAGFMAIDHYLKNKSVKFKEKNNGEYAELNINGEKVIFLKPLSFMNSSGSVVSSFVNYYNILVEDILILHDDMDFEVGSYKIKPTGSGGGHNGVKDIVKSLKTENFKRIRIGISKNDNNMIDYVLGHFSKSDLIKLDLVYKQIDNIIDDFVILDFERLMSKYN